MKVLLFIETGGPGGAERVVSTLASALTRFPGIDVVVATLREGWLTDRLDEKGITRKLVRSKSKRLLIQDLISIIKSEKVDIIHSHLLDSNFYAAIASFLCRVPLIATEHGDVHHLEKKKFPRIKIRTISFFANKVLAVSSFTREALVNLGLRPDRCIVFPNPFHFADTGTSGDKESRLRNILGISSHEPLPWIWIHVANLRKVKDQETLIRGYAGASSRSSFAQRLLIAGDGPERDRLEEMCEQLGVTDEVRFLGFRQDVLDLLKLCDGFILSSISEAMPMSILEASSAGLLLVSSAVGGIPELIREGETGYLFPAKDHVKLSSLIDRAVSEPKQSKMIAFKAREELKEKTDLKRVVERLLLLYDEL